MPFLAPGDLERAGLPGDGITITNPLVAEESVLRTSLLPGLLKAVRHNVSHRNEDIALFEVGHVFKRPADPDAELPDERESFAVIVHGADATVAVQAWRTVCDGLGVPNADVANAEMAAMHPTRSGIARVEGEPVGTLGEVDPALEERIGDVMAIPIGGWMLASRVDPTVSSLIGQHGATSDAEVLIPALLRRA